MGADIEGEDKYTHNIDSGWPIRDSNNYYLGFTIKPVTKNGQAAYASMSTFGIIWDAYEKTQYTSYYKYYDYKDTTYATYYNDFNNKIYNYDTGISQSYSDVAMDEYEYGKNYSKYGAGYKEFLSQRVYNQDEYIMAAFTVYYNLMTDSSIDLSNKTNGEIVDMFLGRLYSFLDSYPSWGKNGKWIEDYATNPVYAELLNKFNNEKNTQVLSCSLATLANDEFNKDSNRFAPEEYGKSYLVNEFSGIKDDYKKYAFCTYCKLVESVSNFNELNNSEVIDKYMDLIYANCDFYSTANWSAINSYSNISYEIIFTDINDKICEACQVKTGVIYTESIPNRYSISNIPGALKDYSDPGFDPEKIKRIDLIVLENQGSYSGEIGIRAFQWIKTGSDSNEAYNMNLPDSFEDVYSGCKNTKDIANLIVSEKIATVPFIVDKGVTAQPKYMLRLVYNSPDYNTGINEVNNHPLDDSATGYLQDTSAYNLTTCKRAVMWFDMDEKYCKFLDDNF